MADYQEFMQRADETALSLTRNSQNWTAFLVFVNNISGDLIFYRIYVKIK